MAKSDDLKWTERKWHKIDFFCGYAISKSELQNLEKLLAGDPDNCDAHRVLLGYYERNLYYCSGSNLELAKKEYTKHLIWLIQNHPDNEDLGLCQTVLNVDFRKIEEAWNKVLLDNSENSEVQKNAAVFFDWFTIMEKSSHD